MDRKTLKVLSRTFAPALLSVTRFFLPAIVMKDVAPSIAVLKLVGLGDTALMLPVIRHLKQTFPDYKLTVIVSPATLPLLAASSDVDDVILYNVLDSGVSGFLRILLKLRQRRFEIFLDFEQNIQMTPFLAAVSGAPVRIGLSHPEHDRGRLFTHPVTYDEKVRMINVFHHLYRNLCVAKGRYAISLNKISEFRILIPVECNATALAWRLRSVPQGQFLVGIHSGSGGTNVYRRWPQERFAELIRRLLAKGNYHVVLTAGPDEISMAEDLRKSLDNERVLSAAGYSFKDFLGLLGVLDCYLSNDTGPLHISSWVGTPTVGLFGPESPIRYGSSLPECVNLYKPISCSPCIVVHKGINPLCSHQVKGSCLKEITVNEVYQQVTTLAEKSSVKRLW
jgi:heptosyltransferase-2